MLACARSALAVVFLVLFFFPEHARRTPPLPPTGRKGHDGVHGGILKDYVRELAHFLRHGRKGKILIATPRMSRRNLPVSCCGKKPLAVWTRR